MQREAKEGAGRTGEAEGAIVRLVGSGLAAYDRRRHLPRVLPGAEGGLSDTSREGRLRTIARLARALRAERMRGVAGHWTYDLNRHLALAQAYAAERARLGDALAP